jgi:hypothetical protein
MNQGEVALAGSPTGACVFAVGNLNSDGDPVLWITMAISEQVCRETLPEGGRNGRTSRNELRVFVSRSDERKLNEPFLRILSALLQSGAVVDIDASRGRRAAALSSGLKFTRSAPYR